MVLVRYWGVRRHVTALVLTFGVPLGMLWAPFVHAHPDHVHHASAVHAHLGGHAHHHGDHGDHEAHLGLTVHEPDGERAIYLDALVALDATPVAIVGAPTPVFRPAAPPELPAHAAVEVTHGHDPPLADPLDSRPPPASLS